MKPSGSQAFAKAALTLQCGLHPPSIISALAVTKAAAPLHKNSTAPITSRSLPMRPKAVRDCRQCQNLGSVSMGAVTAFQ